MGGKMRVPVSVVVLTKNEEANIQGCLDALRAFGEVFVVDSASTDATVLLSRQSGARVVAFAWNGCYPKKKQWALDNLPFTYPWVLYVDADEIVTPSLAQEIDSVVRDGPRHSGYWVELDYVFEDQVLRHGHRARKVVLLRRARARFPVVDDLEAENMWEVEGHYQPVVDGATGRLRCRLVHHDADSLFHYFERHNRYSDWEASTRSRRAAATAVDVASSRKTLKLLFARLPFQGALAFVHSYVAKAGFMDGRAGFDFAIARAFYYWQIGLKRRELMRRASDCNRRD